MRRSAGAGDLLGAYRPGTSSMHAAPLGLKAGVLVVLSVAVLALRSPVLLALAAVLVLTAYAAAGLLRESWVPLRLMWPVLVLLGVFQWWASGVEAAVMVTGNIAVCVTAARLLTLTTAPQELLDGLVSLARPLRPLGADPERFGLTLALMLRSIPFLLGSARDVRESAMARGLERNPRALTVPVVIRAVAYARQTGDALAARGIGERSETKVAKGNR
ncbi:energy-coupling factor transporter transmembrane component T [Arthrobacter sp. zg-Y769]|uniref:energy-coupling factor transporter transmembrane component T n=1 Tax=Arthrobacter sp. zg-Y769 TaxID=2894191 RepID=UPI001E428359|nr:energy-coupling factor transporter transmembrane protein EcfT [Arthrobacter sp. zg-Y769]MCC9204777.1 energy-coupling factor transporter transmembrane protein EcfT [Arthrobacter sp. zg-Y769]